MFSTSSNSSIVIHSFRGCAINLSSFFLYMEQTRRRRYAYPQKSSLAPKILLLLLVFLLLCCSSLFSCALSQEEEEEVENKMLFKEEEEDSSSSTDPPGGLGGGLSRSPAFKTRRFLLRIISSILLGILTGLVFSLLFALLLVRWFVRYINRTPILKGPVVFSPKIPAKTLQLALATNQNQLLGSSPNGKYYKAILDNGLTVAVKRLEPSSFEPETTTTHHQSSSSNKKKKSVKRRMIQQELEVLACLRHRNLMSLRAYIREFDRFCLVYDYVPSGSLEDAMCKVRQNQIHLGWEARLRIAIGIVKALQYLHFSCNPPVFHYNLKPTNVMLDSESEPRLADCGLAKFIPNFNRVASSSSSGYRAPESFQNCRYTDKSDIFSFGVILAVLLTGRNPVDPSFGDGGSLGQWLRGVQQSGEAREALDKSIIGEEGEEDEMVMAVRIAVVCLSDLPADRPSSDELVSMLTQLNSF